MKGGNPVSRYVYLFCVALMCYASFGFYPRWNKENTEATISWDVSGYYWYLPSVFIYKDLKHQSFKDSVLNKYRPSNTDFQQGLKVDNGNYSMKYSSGMAFMYLPFFTAAHLLSGALGYPRDGFSAPYQFAIQLGGLLVALLGLWYLRRLLLMFYSDRVVGITMLLLVVGSNYLNYAAIDVGMSHSWLFTVYVFLLLNTVYFYRNYEMKYAVRIGLLIGLATLTRPTDALSALIPVLWGMERISVSAIKERLALVVKQYKPLLVAAVCAGAVVSIQLMYWKYVSGHWVVYSYGTTSAENQHIYFRSPYFFNYTFSYRSGWLLYSPMMMLAFAGIIPFLFRGKNKVAIVSFFLLNYYLVCAWSIWWYGGRAMVQSYPVLLFCIAALVDVALSKKLLLAVLVPVIAVFAYMNIWITVQEHVGEKLYDDVTMNEPFFWRVVGRWHVPPRTVLLKDNTEVYEGAMKEPKLVYENSFAADTVNEHIYDSARKVKTLMLTKEHQWSPDYVYTLPKTSDQWMRVQATFRCENLEYEIWKMPQFVVRITDSGQKVKENMIRVYRMMQPFQTKDMAVDVRLPSAYDSVHVFFWNGDGDKPLWISDIKAWTFKE